MTRIAIVLAMVCTVVATSAVAQNVLVNGDFESSGPPPLVNGNNINHPIPPWILGTGDQANVVQVDGPGGYNYGLGGPESDASHPGAGVLQHYLDINGINDFYQIFTPRCDGVVSFGGFFSSRGNQQGQATVTLRKGTGTSGAVVGTNTVTVPGGNSVTDPWTPANFTATMVAGQTYSFVVSMNNEMNFDDAYVRYAEDCNPEACMKAEIETPFCNPNSTFTANVIVTNTSTQTTNYVLIAPSPTATYTVSPNVVPAVLNPNQSVTVPVTISGASAGQQICLRLFLQVVEGSMCCLIVQCFDLPHCACMKIVEESVSCDPGPAAFTYTFTIRNETSAMIQQLFDIPSAGTATPQLIATNLAPNTQTTVTLHLGGVNAGQPVCFVLQAFGGDLKECCTIRVCVSMPTGPACD